VYDSGDADLSYEILCIHNTITLAPRVGLSAMILNDRTAQNGINAGIVVRHRTSDNGFLRVDAIYRRLAERGWGTLAAGVEFWPRKGTAP
jgi:hypothetical protein